MKLLFVCLGNICRSPTAEAVMTGLIQQRGLAHRVSCDSAGTGAWHVGERADHRMRKHAARRGYELTSIARQFHRTDFETFDMILAMDDDNYADLVRLDTGGCHRSTLHRMVSFCTQLTVDEVPDPYYGGESGFERVLDILEDACDGLLVKVHAELAD